MMTLSERMGSFFLGAEYDLENGSLGDTLVHYDARDLTTHAVCVGMTGSGKTGLCIGLLEEAALDRVPAIVIDPKGDMTNLLLQFKDLAPGDFLPWINADDARRKGLDKEAFAEDTAELWKNGLKKWGIGPERIEALRNSVEYTIYTPGSDAGVPVNVLGGLSAPPSGEDLAEEHLRERIDGVVSALLGLVGIEADPVRSRESILLATLFDHFWRQGRELDLASLIRAIQDPPVRQLGVFDVDTFFPEKDRFELAMALNALIASPSFGLWRTGDPLEVDSLFFRPDGTPRHCVFYIAHLPEAERMFFVTLLLESVVSWVRRQTGTTSLRALLYFDEIFGYLPPTAQPPSKRPLLTLLKQARAFGLGSVLVTQNPVDIDYKALTNAGTWFIGKLQAERDITRLLDGLRGVVASGGDSDVVDFKKIIAQLDSRVFLMHNVHDDRPTIFHTRWAMSYLRGPMTRPQIRSLMAGQIDAATETVTSEDVSKPARRVAAAPEVGPNVSPPSLGPDIKPVYVPVSVAQAEALRQVDIDNPAGVALLYKLAVLAHTNVRFVDRKSGADHEEVSTVVETEIDPTGGIDWALAEAIDLSRADLQEDPQIPPQTSALYGEPIDDINSPADLSRLKKSLSEWLYRRSSYPLLSNDELDLTQRPGEREESFRNRLRQAARERRDAEVDKLEVSFARKIDRIEDRIERKLRTAENYESTYESRKQEEWISIGESVLGVFLGRRGRRGLSTAARKRRMTSQAKDKMETSREEAASLRAELAELEAELEDAIRDISDRWETAAESVQAVELKPRRVDVQIPLFTVAWLPHWRISTESEAAISVAAYRPTVRRYVSD